MSRFECPSSYLSLSTLLTRSRRLIGLAVFLSLILHVSLAQIRFTREERRAEKPLSTKFIKREPRLIKPLELRKHPKPKLRAMRRRMVVTEIRSAIISEVPATSPLRVLDNLAKPTSKIGRTVPFVPPSLEMPIGSSAIEGKREPKIEINMDLEMLDIDALDTGKYYAMVIQDPHDKKKIRGFFHFCQAQSVTMRNSMVYDDIGRHARAIAKLVEAINRYTDIRCDVAEVLTFDSSDLMRVPLVLTVTRFPFELTDSESSHLGEYLLSGGFLLTDASYHSSEQPGLSSLHEMIVKALETQGVSEGRDYVFEVIPHDHPVYHCFFDFDDGPPVAGDFKQIIDKGMLPYELEGVALDGRLVVIESKKWLCNAWSDWGRVVAGLTNYANFEPTRQLQFGVNIVIFALTQEGSITYQTMSRVR